MPAEFDRCNLNELDLVEICAHGGAGKIRFNRIVERDSLAGTCNFIDLAELPPGASIGRHAHAIDEEEFFLVLSGEGRMWRNGEIFDVRACDLIRNPPAGEHELVNTGRVPLRLFVFEVRVKVVR
jgi:mannose-6-phosphate isomerase-like protein (cupin superfamily)